MGEDSEPLTADGRTPPEISHRRLLFEMVFVVTAGAAAGFAVFSARAGFGVLIGGILAFANYFWQKHSLKAIFDRAVDGKQSRFLALRYILRYVAIGAAVAWIYWSETVSIFGVIFGLASFSIAVVIEGFTNIFSSSNREES